MTDIPEYSKYFQPFSIEQLLYKLPRSYRYAYVSLLRMTTDTIHDIWFHLTISNEPGWENELIDPYLIMIIQDLRTNPIYKKEFFSLVHALTVMSDDSIDSLFEFFRERNLDDQIKHPIKYEKTPVGMNDIRIQLESQHTDDQPDTIQITKEAMHLLRKKHN